MVWVSGVLVAGSAAQERAIPRALLRAVPGDVVAAYFMAGPDTGRSADRRTIIASPTSKGDGPPVSPTSQRSAPPGGGTRPAAAPSDGRPSLLQWGPLVADYAHRLGLLSHTSDRVRLWTDVLASAAVVLRYPHAVALFDIRARARADGGHELAGAEAALILLTRGDNMMIAQRIQHLLNTYTNAEETVLEIRATGATTSRPAVFTIHDRRLPDWVRITWGQVGDHYIVAIGSGVFERVAATLSNHTAGLANDRWFWEALAQPFSRGATASESVSVNPSFAAYVRFDRLGDRVDPGLGEKIGSVQAALGLADVTRALWTYTRVGRSVEATCRFQRDGRDTISLIMGGGGNRLESAEGAEGTEGRRDGRTKGRAIPEQAGGYALIHSDPSTILRGACRAYLAARSPGAAEKKRAFWRDFEADAGVSLERDIFSHLRSPIAIHSYPPHPLRLPLAWTIVVPTDGSAGVLRRNVNRWLAEAKKRLEQPGLTEAKPGVTSLLQLKRDTDGLWYTQLGLVGPALLVTDQWLVISFSPRAVRRNLILLSSDSR